MKSINWFDKFIEVLVVIIGISIAFGLNNWNQATKDRKLEKKYMESMIYDLDSDIEELTVMLDTFKYFNNQNAQLIKSITSSNLNEDSLAYYVISLISFSEFHSQDNTYETLKSSGNFNLFKNFELEKQITKLYNTEYQKLELIDGIHRSTIMDDLNPYISEHVSFTSASSVSNTDFASSNYFINKAFNIQYLMLGKTSSYKEGLEQAIKVRDMLNLELEGS